MPSCVLLTTVSRPTPRHFEVGQRNHTGQPMNLQTGISGVSQLATELLGALRLCFQFVSGIKHLHHKQNESGL